jgi:hypothetical protein
VAISFLFPQGLGYSNEKKEKDQKGEVHGKERNEDNSKNSGEGITKIVYTSI